MLFCKEFLLVVLLCALSCNAFLHDSRENESDGPTNFVEEDRYEERRAHRNHRPPPSEEELPHHEESGELYPRHRPRQWRPRDHSRSGPRHNGRHNDWCRRHHERHEWGQRHHERRDWWSRHHDDEEWCPRHHEKCDDFRPRHHGRHHEREDDESRPRHHEREDDECRPRHHEREDHDDYRPRHHRRHHEREDDDDCRPRHYGHDWCHRRDWCPEHHERHHGRPHHSGHSRHFASCPILHAQFPFDFTKFEGSWTATAILEAFSHSEKIDCMNISFVQDKTHLHHADIDAVILENGTRTEYKAKGYIYFPHFQPSRMLVGYNKTLMEWTALLSDYKTYTLYHICYLYFGEDGEYRVPIQSAAILTRNGQISDDTFAVLENVITSYGFNASLIYKLASPGQC